MNIEEINQVFADVNAKIAGKGKASDSHRDYELERMVNELPTAPKCAEPYDIGAEMENFFNHYQHYRLNASEFFVFQYILQCYVENGNKPIRLTAEDMKSLFRIPEEEYYRIIGKYILMGFLRTDTSGDNTLLFIDYEGLLDCLPKIIRKRKDAWWCYREMESFIKSQIKHIARKNGEV